MTVRSVKFLTVGILNILLIQNYEKTFFEELMVSNLFKSNLVFENKFTFHEKRLKAATVVSLFCGVMATRMRSLNYY